MADKRQPAVQDSLEDANLAQTAVDARHSWRQLGLSIKSVTPATLLRLILLTIGFGGIIWLGWATWPALLPFIVGAVIAYAVLPFTNWLDRFLPRILAVTIALLTTILIIGAIIAASATILGRQVYFLYRSLPSQEEINVAIANLREYTHTFPAPAQTLINDVLQQTSVRVRANIDQYNQNMVDVVFAGVAALFNTLGFVLGFLVVPAWLLLVLKDQKAGAQAMRRLLPAWMLPDLMAVWSIFDRTLRAFIEGQVVLGLFVTLAMYIGLMFLETIGLVQVQYKLAAAIFAGVMQLIPNIGPIVTIFIILLTRITGAGTSQVLALLGLYLVVQELLRLTTLPKVEEKIISGVHPALLIMAIVALSEFGWLWVLLAAPITAVLRDMFLYTYGRLSDPPRPAGLLPGESLPPPKSDAAKRAANVPAAYRHGRAAR